MTRAAARYSLALIAVLAVAALRQLAGPFLHPEPVFLFFPLAVFVIAWRLGLGPALCATAAAALIGWSFFFAPGVEAAQRTAHTLVFLLQAAATSAIAWHLSRLRGARLQADRRAAGFLDNIDDAFFAVDAAWRFTFLNRHFEGYARGPAREMPGRVLWEVFPELLGSEVESFYRGVMVRRTAARLDTKSTISDRWFRVYAYPFEDGIAVFSTDITDRLRAGEAIRAAKEEAEAASRMKDEFLATLSHELRTPLNAILGWTQILQSGKADEGALRRGLETIERSAHAQARLIDDLLDVSRIIAGKLRLELRPVDLPEIVDAALAIVTPAAAAKGVCVEKCLTAVAGTVSGDPERLQQVFWNLLSNAVKFTPRGGRVEVCLEPGGDGHVEVRIADDGQGIAPDFLPFVFEPFRQADASTTRRQGGVGLGLSIVRQMVEMHGGSVRVESEGEGRGAVVTVALPLAPPL
jgi:signal transduction histidine kinase